MKYLKMLGLAALAAGALMALSVSGASATELDCSASTMCPAETTIHAVNEGIVKLDSEPFPIECRTSTVQGKTTNTGSSAETVDGPIETLTFGECGGWAVTVLKKGSLEIHTRTTSADGNGTLTSKEAEVTVEGFGLHCIYGTGTGHDIGTLTGSKNTGSTAVFHIEANVTLLGGRSGSFCPGPTVAWTGTYSVTTPMYLDVT